MATSTRTRDRAAGGAHKAVESRAVADAAKTVDDPQAALQAAIDENVRSGWEEIRAILVRRKLTIVPVEKPQEIIRGCLWAARAVGVRVVPAK